MLLLLLLLLLLNRTRNWVHRCQTATSGALTFFIITALEKIIFVDFELNFEVEVEVIRVEVIKFETNIFEVGGV